MSPGKQKEPKEIAAPEGWVPGSSMDAVANLPKDMAIMKMENENIMTMAAARPRNQKMILANVLEQIDTYPSFAGECIYSKPVGKDKGGVPKYARGLSIRAAEALAEAYGFCRVRSDVTPIDEDHVKVEATFTDYQKGRIWQDGGVVSKFYKARTGQMVRHSDDRFYNVVVKAEASRRLREVILRSVPPGLRAEMMEVAEKRIDELLDDKTIEKIVGQFASKGVDLEALEKAVGRTRKAGWTKEDRRTLVGLWNSIKEGETTISDAFGEQEAVPERPKEVEATLDGSTVSAEDGIDIKPEKKGRTKEEKDLFPKVAGIVSLFQNIKDKDGFESFPFDHQRTLKHFSEPEITQFMEQYNAFGAEKGWRTLGQPKRPDPQS